jgi:hypothetical protein
MRGFIPDDIADAAQEVGHLYLKAVAVVDGYKRIQDFDLGAVLRSLYRPGYRYNGSTGTNALTGPLKRSAEVAVRARVDWDS